MDKQKEQAFGKSQKEPWGYVIKLTCIQIKKYKKTFFFFFYCNTS